MERQNPFDDLKKKQDDKKNESPFSVSHDGALERARTITPESLNRMSTYDEEDEELESPNDSSLPEPAELPEEVVPEAEEPAPADNPATEQEQAQQSLANMVNKNIKEETQTTNEPETNNQPAEEALPTTPEAPAEAQEQPTETPPAQTYVNSNARVPEASRAAGAHAAKSKGLDPLAIMGVVCIWAPIIGLIISFISLGRYKKGKYSTAKWLNYLTIVLSIVFLVIEGILYAKTSVFSGLGPVILQK